jgi:hypothetical protein
MRVGVLARSDRSANYRKFATASIGMGDERSLRAGLTPKLASDSEKDTNMEMTIDRQAGRPRLWVRRKGHPEPLAVYTYVCLPDTVDPRGVKGK